MTTSWFWLCAEFSQIVKTCKFFDYVQNARKSYERVGISPNAEYKQDRMAKLPCSVCTLTAGTLSQACKASQSFVRSPIITNTGSGAGEIPASGRVGTFYIQAG